MKVVLLSVAIIIFFIDAKAGYSDGPFPITATETNPFGGGYAKALIYLNYVNSDRKIRKPLIVFEGYDPGYYTKPKEKEGRTGLQDFIDDIEDDKLNGVRSQLEILLRGNPDASLPIIQQYDIIYVNWKNGTDYLENNEKVAKAVINWVNQQKALAGSTEPNVIIGRSMGAVIARMALKHMEQERAANPAKPLHNTRLLISNDSSMSRTGDVAMKKNKKRRSN